jgi:hypothetical protein
MTSKRVKTPEQKACYRVTETARKERIAENRRLARNEHELLKLILEDAKIEHLSLDMQLEDLKKMIQIKKRELEAIRQNIKKR